MIRPATAMAVRRYRRTALAVLGPYATHSGVTFRTRPRHILRIPDSPLVLATVEAEGAGQILKSFLCGVDPQVGPEGMVLALAAAWMVDPALRAVRHPALVACEERVWLVGPDGQAAEPEDGIGATGAFADCASGAAKALLLHTEMTAEAIVTEALRIASACGGVPDATPIVELLPEVA